MPLRALLPLAKVQGISWFSLQKGVAVEQMRGLAAEFPVVDASSESRDFAETAALVATLDVVISVDTSIAHLAGAMGKPVWVVLPHLADWRWMDERGDSAWYPTARLFRQKLAGDWRAPVARMHDELRKLITVWGGIRGRVGSGAGAEFRGEWVGAGIAPRGGYVTGCGAGMGPGYGSGSGSGAGPGAGSGVGGVGGSRAGSGPGSIPGMELRLTWGSVARGID
jgi:hypothetical protein